ncbi:MGMT family protein [Methylomicrobium sp. Wu6]|uniref:methylated-DNA--[protein]-cysteine S-methyltransferase n=1 Tax=Methylomicrobium sp. Wu6 TaxID=3107928 RepID=UPI002DD66637|nr:MGMT family protein [Methylomicrobium sp. Wu6]MEC4750431.1 MGMT family protein [Methylomicrobium sp. Wu6]
MSFSITWVEGCTGPAQIVATQTPAGLLALTVCGDVIVNTDWLLDHDMAPPVSEFWQRVFDAYWSTPDHTIELNLLAQGSPYRRRVWGALCRIPCGTTASYSALSKNLASSPRAVGNACRDNPYAPIIPCHRVVSASGMGGYCGATEGPLLDIKIKLLRFEAEHCR